MALYHCVYLHTIVSGTSNFILLCVSTHNSFWNFKQVNLYESYVTVALYYCVYLQYLHTVALYHCVYLQYLRTVALYHCVYLQYLHTVALYHCVYLQYLQARSARSVGNSAIEN